MGSPFWCVVLGLFAVVYWFFIKSLVINHSFLFALSLLPYVRNLSPWTWAIATAFQYIFISFSLPSNLAYCSELPKSLPSSCSSSHYLSKQVHIFWFRIYAVSTKLLFLPTYLYKTSFLPLSLFLFKFYISFKSSFKFPIVIVAFLVKYTHYVISNFRTLGTYFEFHSDCKSLMV